LIGAFCVSEYLVFKVFCCFLFLFLDIIYENCV
jgi:hypothetical protein